MLAVALAVGACGGTPAPRAVGSPRHGGATTATVRTTTTTSSTTTTTVPVTVPTAAPGAPAALGPLTSPPLPPPGPGFVAGRVDAVGDSVMIDYQQPLEQDIPGIVVDAAVSRQWGDGEALLSSLKASGQLGAVVVVGLSTNGPIMTSDMQAMMAILSGASRIVFVTVNVDQPWQDPNNAVLEAAAQQYPNVVIADWHALAAANPSWLYSDGTHLPVDGPGAQALAALVASKV